MEYAQLESNKLSIYYKSLLVYSLKWGAINVLLKTENKRLEVLINKEDITRIINILTTHIN